MLRLFKSRRPASEGQGALLLADSDADFRRLLGESFSGRITSALTGKDALRTAREETFNIAVVDYDLPDMNGLELFRRLRKIQPEMETLLLASRSAAAGSREALVEGALGFLLKPVSVEDLAKVLGKALEKQRVRQEHTRIIAHLTAVNEMFLATSSQSDAEGIEMAAIGKLTDLFGFDFAVIHELVDGFLLLKHHRGLPEKAARFLARTPFDEERLGEYVKSGEKGTTPFGDLSGVLECDCFHHSVIPLSSPGGFKGFLSVGFTRDRPIHPHEEELLGFVGQHIAMAVEKANLYESACKAHRKLAETQRQMIDSEKMSTLGALAAGFADELRNPLNSINLQLEVLERRLGRSGDAVGDELAPTLEAIREEAGRLDSFIDEFLFFAKPRKHKPTRFDLLDLLSEVRDHVRDELEARGVEMTLVRTRPLTVMRSDREKLKLALLHLVSNALGAMPSGGRITITAGGEDRAVITVRDTGEGIVHPKKVFAMFHSTKERGTGLGLPIVKQIVDSLHGKIDFETRRGAGTTFRIELPWDIKHATA